MKIYDTIAAVATPIGSGGVAIIRVSGEDAVRISQSIIKTRSGKALSELESHKLTLSYVCDPDAEKRYNRPGSRRRHVFAFVLYGRGRGRDKLPRRLLRRADDTRPAFKGGARGSQNPASLPVGRL